MASDPGPVRIALIGAGRMGRVHLEALERCDRVTVAAIVDPVPDVRATLEGRGHRTCAHVDELPAESRLEAVVIAAPSDFHLDLVRRFARAGLAILCEKPVGVHPHDASEAAAVAAEAGVILQVGFWRRFVPALQALRGRLRAGELGELGLIACHQWDELPPSPAFRAHSGGIAVDMAVHEFDQVRWLTGRDVEWVAAAGAPGEDPDVAAILARLSGGAAASISLGRRFAHGDCCWLEAFGTAGFERVEFMWGAEGERVFRDAVLAQLEAFVDAIQGSEQVGADGPDAIAALTAAHLAGEALLSRRSRELADTVPALR